MDDAEYDEIQGAADTRRLTVSAWVRQTLREARAPDASTTQDTLEPQRTATPNPELVRQVMHRHGLATPAEALDFALRRAAEPPLSRNDMLSLRGTGWSGDLAVLRANPRGATGSDDGPTS